MGRTKMEGMSQDEFNALGETYGIDEMSRLIRLSKRVTEKHAEELGGTLINGEWVFHKSDFDKLFTAGPKVEAVC